MRETIELYGTSYHNENDDGSEYVGVSGPFFCGMSLLMVIPQFNIRLNGPTSTSKCIEVAQRFGGMIIIYTYFCASSISSCFLVLNR